MSATISFPASTSDATIAAYFRFGLQAGAFSIEAPKAWAYEVIRLRESPSIHIIEIATTNHLRDMESLLAEIAPGADLEQAGRWLLKDIAQRLEDREWALQKTIEHARQIAIVAELPENIEWNLIGMLDALHLAESEICGDTETVRRETKDYLLSECRDTHRCVGS